MDPPAPRPQYSCRISENLKTTVAVATCPPLPLVAAPMIVVDTNFFYKSSPACLSLHTQPTPYTVFVNF